MPEDPDEADVILITNYTNTVPAVDALNWLDENGCIVEQAWLAARMTSLERSFVISVMTAYASARGELKNIRLTIPPVEE